MTSTSIAAQRQSTDNRIAELDALRGFALLGILIANVIAVGALLTIVGSGENVRLIFDAPIDLAVTGTVTALFLGKFYLLFSFLFGYSFTLQIAAAERVGVSARARLLRRCAALFLIGLAHVFLLWFGDILTLYAVLCLVLIVMRRVRPITAVITGCVLYLAFASLFLLGGDESGGDDLPFLQAQTFHDAYTGSAADTFAAQLAIAPSFIGFIWLAQGVTALALFLLGMAAGKRRLFERRDVIRRWSPWVMWIGLGVGLPVAAATLAAEIGWIEMSSALEGVQFLVNPLMTFAYIAILLRLAAGRRTSRLVAWLAPAGRMAASNYIGQSVVFMVIYTGYGLALVDDVPPAGLIGIALLTFIAQLAASAWWMRRFAYGPVEGLLRAATNWTAPTWRRRPRTHDAA